MLYFYFSIKNVGCRQPFMVATPTFIIEPYYRTEQLCGKDTLFQRILLLTARWLGCIASEPSSRVGEI